MLRELEKQKTISAMKIPEMVSIKKMYSWLILLIYFIGMLSISKCKATRKGNKLTEYKKWAKNRLFENYSFFLRGWKLWKSVGVNLVSVWWSKCTFFIGTKYEWKIGVKTFIAMFQTIDKNSRGERVVKKKGSRLLGKSASSRVETVNRPYTASSNVFRFFFLVKRTQFFIKFNILKVSKPEMWHVIPNVRNIYSEPYPEYKIWSRYSEHVT